MANFKEEFEKIVLTEGGYVNDPDDAGGETYLGISRKHHPYSPIWSIIDDYTNRFFDREITKNLKKNKKVTKLVSDIYKYEYWDIFDLDSVPNQKIAHEIFDDAVNRGVKNAIILAEQVMGMTPTGKITDALLYNLKRYV